MLIKVSNNSGFIDNYINTASLKAKFDSLSNKTCYGIDVGKCEYIMAFVIDGERLALSKWRSTQARIFKRADSLITEAKNFGFDSICFVESDELNRAANLIEFSSPFTHDIVTVSTEYLTHASLHYGLDLFGLEVFHGGKSIGVIDYTEALKFFGPKGGLFQNGFTHLLTALEAIEDKNQWLDHRNIKIAHEDSAGEALSKLGLSNHSKTESQINETIPANEVFIGLNNKENGLTGLRYLEFWMSHLVNLGIKLSISRHDYESGKIESGINDDVLRSQPLQVREGHIQRIKSNVHIED